MTLTTTSMTTTNSDKSMKPDRHSVSSLCECKVIALSRHRHQRGSLTAVQNDDTLPFAIKRVFYIYDVPAGSERGGHSHFEMEELIVAAAGGFTVTLFDGRDTRRISLNRPYEALYVPAGIWRVIDDFSSGSICLALASSNYDPDDYVYDYDRYLSLTASKRENND